MTTTDVATGRAGLIRVAAVGDVHVTAARTGRFRPALLRLRELADLVLLAGDLTERGTVTEAVYLADELRGLGLPAVAVLGNHDHLSGSRGAAVVATALADAGVVLLENSGVVVPVNGVRVGIAGTMGFGGGFYVTGSHEWADGFAAALAGLDCEVRVALTHCAPTVDTLVGEPERLYPVLGCAALGAAIDRGGVDLAVHGHAHHGREHGATPAGVAVRNVAYPVIRSSARVYHLTRRSDHGVDVTIASTSGVNWSGATRWRAHRTADIAARVLRRLL